MSIEIKKCAVLGAGVMGAQIAGHIANAGIPSLLFDINDDLAKNGVEGLTKLKPAPLFSSKNTSLVTPCTYDNDLEKYVFVAKDGDGYYLYNDKGGKINIYNIPNIIHRLPKSVFDEASKNFNMKISVNNDILDLINNLSKFVFDIGPKNGLFGSSIELINKNSERKNLSLPFKTELIKDNELELTLSNSNVYNPVKELVTAELCKVKPPDCGACACVVKSIKLILTPLFEN